MTEGKMEVDWGNSKLQKAEKQIDDSLYDLEAWSLLIREAQGKCIGEMRPFFEKLVLTFPSAGRYWKIYIEQEMKAGNFEKAEKLFQRCLVKVLNIDLWKLYLVYIKETKSTLPTYKKKMAQAYIFALEKIGMDIHSYSIWNDYINFLKAAEAVGSYAENQKTSAVREVYQRGVINPMVNIEQLWKDYINFEQNLNPVIAEKMTIDRNRDYTSARRVAREFKAVTRALNRNRPSVPPTGHPEELKQIDLWKKYISWEKLNPLRTEDAMLITRRVMFAFEQCLLCLGHHPDIWYEAAQFLEQSSKLLTEKGDVNAAKLFSDEAAAVYERATASLLKKNMLLNFAYADFEEGRRHYEKAQQIYNRYLDITDVDPTLAYIQYMRFARRTGGIKSARTVFKQAREDTRSTFHVFVAAALMEYYCSKDKNIAFRIFELGLKKFSDYPEYILCYIDYLSHLNEDNNTRVLFERVLSSGNLKPEKSVDICNRFLEFESNIGDLASIVKVEKRRSAVLSQIKEFEGKETAQLVDRYKFLDLYPCTPAELMSISYSEVASTAVKPFHLLSSTIIHPEDKSSNMPRPDFTQMIPFKPKTRTIPGYVFPHPPAVAQLCELLPPPGCFQGPFVAVDMLMDVFRKIQLPETAPSRIADNGCDTELFDLAKSVQWTVDAGREGRGTKRRWKLGTGARSGAEDSEDDELSSAPPTNDVYRRRQRKRFKRLLDRREEGS
jgi:cleavage stimulation factor subunit 3